MAKKMAVNTLEQLDAQQEARKQKLRDEAKKARQNADEISVQMEDALAENDTNRFMELYAKRAAFESAATGYIRMIDEQKKQYSDSDVRECWNGCVEEYKKPYEAAMKAYKACCSALVDAYIALAKEQNKMLGIRDALKSRLEKGDLAQFPKMPAFSAEFRTLFKDELAARSMSTNPMSPCPLAYIANIMTGGQHVRDF